MSNQPDHSSRGHAEFSPSSLKYVAKCGGYDGRSGTSAAAERGTRIHEALEVWDPTLLHDEEEIEIYEWIVEAESNYLKHFFKSEKYSEHNEIQVDVALDGTNTWGTCDRLLISGSKALMADYKTGISMIDEPRENWQAKAYTLGAFQKFPELETLTFVFYVPMREEVLQGLFTREDDVENLTEELSTVIKRGESIRPQWLRNKPDMDLLSPSVNCRFCKHEDHCPALGGLVLDVASKISDILPDTDIEDTEDPEVVEKLWVVAKIVNNWATRFKVKAINMAKDGAEFSSLRLRSMGSSRACNDNKKLISIAEDYGLDLDDVLSLAKFPLSKLADLAGSKAPKGEKGATVKNFLDNLEESGIIENSAERFTLAEVKEQK